MPHIWPTAKEEKTHFLAAETETMKNRKQRVFLCWWVVGFFYDQKVRRIAKKKYLEVKVG